MARRAERRQGVGRLRPPGEPRSPARCSRAPTSCSRASARRRRAPRRRPGRCAPRRAVYCSITGFGSTGRTSSARATTSTTSAGPALLADTAPALPPVQIADLAAGALGAVIEVLAALLERERTGRGARLVVSMTHGSHRSSLPPGGDPSRLLTGGVACYRIYETADGRHLTVAALEPKFFARLASCSAPGAVDAAVRARAARARRRCSPRARSASGSSSSTARTPASARCSTLAEARRELRVKLAAIAFALFGIHIGPQRVIPVGYAPAWSANAERIAFVTRGDLGRGHRRHPPFAARVQRERSSLVAERQAPHLFARHLRLDGARRRPRPETLSRSARTPRGRPTARASPTTETERSTRRAGSAATSGTWSRGPTPPTRRPAGWAYVRDGEVIAGTRTIGEGRRSDVVAERRAGRLRLPRQALRRRERRSGNGSQPAWRPHVGVPELLPDLDQRAPAGLIVAGSARHWVLGFTSLVDNVGLGPSMIVGVRSPGQSLMTVTQHIRLANGKWRTYPNAGRLRYTNAPPHHHWHLMKFDIFQLRTLAGAVLMSDRKSGFCLADHWGAAPGVWPGRHPVFLGDCKARPPEGNARRRGGRRSAIPTATRRSSTARTSISRTCLPASTTSYTARTRTSTCASSATRTTRRPCG